MIENHFTAYLELEDLQKAEKSVIDKLYKKSLYRKKQSFIEIYSQSWTKQERKRRDELIEKGIIERNTKKNYSTDKGRCKSYRLIETYYKEVKIRLANTSPYVQNNLFSDDDLHKWILDCFRSVSISTQATPQNTRLFLIDNSKLWIKRRDSSSRIYSSVAGLDREYREHLLLDKKPLVKLDIKSCQPYLLARLAKDERLMSECVCKTKDFYRYVGNVIGVHDRDTAKTQIIEALFDKDEAVYRRIINNALQDHFPISYEFMRDVKRTAYNQLAILLEREEVKYMAKVWAILAKERIRFLTIHDCVMVHPEHAEHVTEVMRGVFGKNPPRIALE
jgi:hypothetical protein